MDFEITIPPGVLDEVQHELEVVVGGLAPGDFPRYIEAVGAAAKDAEATYRRYLSGHPIPGKGALGRASRELARGAYRREAGLLLWAVGNQVDRARWVEEGTKERDLKRMLPTAKRARRAKDGSLYLIIPFRHGIPGTRGIQAMPKEVYALAKMMEHSRRVGHAGQRVSATGWTVPRFTYDWRGRLKPGAMKDAGLDPDGSHRRYAGMVRMGKSGQTTYPTFRVMSEKSKGWIKPATPGLAPLATALQVSWQSNRAALAAALEDDVMRIVNS